MVSEPASKICLALSMSFTGVAKSARTRSGIGGSVGIFSFAAASGVIAAASATANPSMAHDQLVNTAPGLARILDPSGAVAGINATPEKADGSNEL